MAAPCRAQLPSATRGTSAGLVSANLVSAQRFSHPSSSVGSPVVASLVVSDQPCASRGENDSVMRMSADIAGSKEFQVGKGLQYDELARDLAAEGLEIAAADAETHGGCDIAFARPHLRRYENMIRDVDSHQTHEPPLSGTPRPQVPHSVLWPG